MKKTTEKEESFQKSFEELEKIVHEFEKGDLDLDESLGKFERGLELAESCKKRLQDVENRVIEIKKKFSSLQEDSKEEE
ncbi:MAG: exodeoxyribonuclease VII small subunit [bacterium]|nr:exodeoxyribonuclease VII small subunit [bacterium]